MEGRLVLKGCSLMRTDGRIRRGVAVVVEQDRVTRVADDASVPVLPGDWQVSCQGRLVAPGLCDAFADLLGGPLDLAAPDWPLRGARAAWEHRHALGARVTADEVEALTAYSAALSLRRGVTFLVEPLHAPGCVEAALSRQAQVAERLGVRLLHGHLTASAPEALSPEAQLEQNAEHARRVRQHPLVRSALGLWASFLCEDALLRAAGRLREQLGVGTLVRLAEGREDFEATYAKWGRRAVARLDGFGLLGPGGVAALAHAVDRAELDKLARARTLLALVPRTNLWAEPGIAELEAILATPVLVGLGTGGWGTLAEELACAHALTASATRSGRLVDPDGVLARLLYEGTSELRSMLFGAPSGQVDPGALADLVVYDWVPPELEDRAWPHLLLRMGQAPVAWTVVAGRVVVREGRLVGADLLELGREAASAAAALVRRACG